MSSKKTSETRRCDFTSHADVDAPFFFHAWSGVYFRF
jgi:hypothetical protein